jgi:hypothetical protein
MIKVPGTEEPMDSLDIFELDSLKIAIPTINFFMETLSKIDPFIFLNNVHNRIITNRKLLLDDDVDADDIGEAPTEPLGSIMTLNQILKFTGIRMIRKLKHY